MDLDKAGLWVQGVCGFLAGAGLGGWIAWSSRGAGDSFLGGIALVVVSGVVCAILAVKFGDRFFEWLLGGLW